MYARKFTKHLHGMTTYTAKSFTKWSNNCALNGKTFETEVNFSNKVQ